LHQRLFALKVNRALADRDNIEIGLADQQCAKLALTENRKKFCKTAGDVEFQRLLVLAVPYRN
jgi:hypothetical protein